MKVKGKYSCVFGGGAVRGLAYIGAVQAIKELDIDIDVFAGSSVGSIIAAFLAVGYSVEELKDVLLKVNFELFKDIYFSFNKQIALSKGNIFAEWIREAIEKKFYGVSYKKGENKPVTFKDLSENLVILATDLNTFCPFEFSVFKTPDFEVANAVRISCGMPGLMVPVDIDEKKLVDGDLLKGIPLWKLSENINNPKNRVLEFRLEGDSPSNAGNAFNFLNSIYSCMTCVSTDFIMDVYGENDRYDYIKIVTGDIIVVDFNMSVETRKQLIQIGYNNSMKYFKENFVEKKLKNSSNYEKIVVYLYKLQRAVKYNDVGNSFEILKELFLDIPEISKMIDPLIYNMICDLKKQIITASFKKSWLRGKKFSKKETIIEYIKQLLSCIELKKTELDCYVSEISSMTQSYCSSEANAYRD